MNLKTSHGETMGWISAPACHISVKHGGSLVSSVPGGRTSLIFIHNVTLGKFESLQHLLRYLSDPNTLKVTGIRNVFAANDEAF